MSSCWKNVVTPVFSCLLLLSVLIACQSGPMSRVQACNAQALPVVQTFQPVASLKKTVYTASGSHLYALQASNGIPRWCSTLTPDNGQPDRFVGVTHLGDQLYTFTSADTLTALTTHAGAEVWSTNINSLSDSLEGLNRTFSPSVANGTVYAGGTSIVALRSQDGSVRWHYPLPDHFVATTVPFTSNGTIYVTDANDSTSQLVALDAATGTKRWIFSSPHAAFGTDLIAGGGVVVIRYTVGNIGPGFRTGLDVVDAQSGKLLWQNNIDAILWSNNSIANGLLYALASLPLNQQNGVSGLYAYDLRTGMVHWSLPAHTTIGLNLNAPLMVAKNLLYTIDYAGEVNAIDALTGQILWRAPLLSASETPVRLVLSENELFLEAKISAETQFNLALHAFNVTTRTENWEADIIGGDTENNTGIDIGT